MENLATNRRDFIKQTAALTAALALPESLSAEANAPTKPNIVVIYADDLGYGDVHAFNSKSRIPTPNLDRLAKQGMMFTDAHSADAVCTPSRYALITGRYCWRTRKKKGVLYGYSNHLVDPKRTTIATLMKQKGYNTACVGKWHLGMDFAKNGKNKVDYTGPIAKGPNANGFDYFYGVSASLDMPPYVFIENSGFTETPSEHYDGSRFPDYMRPGKIAPSFKPIEVLDNITNKATDYIAEQSEKENPFFLYVPFTSPHKPAMPAPRFKGKSGLGPYGDFIMHTDAMVGKIDSALRAAGIEDETLVIVTSDNGSYMYNFDAEECPARLTSRSRKPKDGSDHVSAPKLQGYNEEHHLANGIYRGTKADIWEAGHRVPFVARWPGRIKPGSSCDKPICQVDLMATCAEIVGAELPENAAEDSFSLLPLFESNPNAWQRAPIVNHSINGTFALRDGKWKLILGKGSGGRGVPKSKPGSTPYQLYNLEEDPSETNNLIDKHPELAKEMKKKLEAIRKAGRNR